MVTQLRRLAQPLKVMALCAFMSGLGCGVYTFSGSTLPGHLKTVDIPLFVNQSLQPDVAEAITSEITRRIAQQNLLKNVARDGDATLSGTVLSYSNQPYTFGSEGYRNVNVSQYVVNIKVDVLFQDNKKSEPIYKGVVSAEGIYEFGREAETDGRTKAIRDIIDQIMQNSVQGW